MRSTSLPRSVAPIAIGPSIAAVPETSCPQSKQTWRSKILMRSSIVNSTLSGFAAPLTTDCMLWIFLCLVLAHAGLFSVGVSCFGLAHTNRDTMARLVFAWFYEKKAGASLK